MLTPHDQKKQIILLQEKIKEVNRIQKASVIVLCVLMVILFMFIWAGVYFFNKIQH